MMRFSLRFIKASIYSIILFGTLATRALAAGEEFINNPKAALIDCFWGISDTPNIGQSIDQYVQLKGPLLLLHAKEAIFGTRPVQRYRYSEPHLPDCFWRAADGSKKDLFAHPSPGTLVYITSPTGVEMLVGAIGTEGEVWDLDNAEIDAFVIQDALSVQIKGIQPIQAPSMPTPSLQSGQKELILEGPQITDQDIERMVKAGDNYISIQLTNCQQVTDKGIEEIAKNCPDLETLDIAKCKQITSNGLLAVAQHCHNFEDLWLDKCPNITGTGIVEIAKKCPHLDIIWITNCAGITDEDIYNIGQHCKNLDDLTLRNNRQLTDKAIINLPASVQDLALSSPKFTDAALEELLQQDLPLQELDIAGCKRITDAGIVIISQIHTLEKLNLRDLKQVTSKGLLNLTALHNLKELITPKGEKLESHKEIQQYLEKLQSTGDNTKG